MVGGVEASEFCLVLLQGNSARSICDLGILARLICCIGKKNCVTEEWRTQVLAVKVRTLERR